VLNLDFDYITYLDELKSHGLNLTRTFCGMYVEQWGPLWNTLNPAPNRYVCPWARSEIPGYKDGGNKFDLTKWDDAYFSRLKDFVSQAGNRGIVVELVLFCVFYDDKNWALCPLNADNNVNGIGLKTRHGIYDESDPATMAVEEKMARLNTTVLMCNPSTTIVRSWQSRVSLMISPSGSKQRRHCVPKSRDFKLYQTKLLSGW
jgi:hypothetical protein